MKKLVILLAGLSLAASAFAGTDPGTGVVGSVHDMNAYNSGAVADIEDRVCAFCHTPHHALVDPEGYEQPLWSHQFTDYTALTVTAYSSPTLDAAISDPLYGPSRLCMSCHDGVVAADQHYDIDGTLTSGLGGDDFGPDGDPGGRDIGLNGNFSNDHPIGFVFADVSAADGGTDAGIFSQTSYFINNPASLAVDDVLTDGFMTCATCHDVHNKDNATNSSGRNYLVYSPQEGSQLCLSCHDKGDGTNDVHP